MPGVACDMDKVMDIAARHDLFVVWRCSTGDRQLLHRDWRRRRPLGSIGHLAAFSFHETKHTMWWRGHASHQYERFIKRAEIIWEKGTNRGWILQRWGNKYGWLILGSSFFRQRYAAAFLWAQIEDIDQNQHHRKKIWKWYSENIGVF